MWRAIELSIVLSDACVEMICRGLLPRRFRRRSQPDLTSLIGKVNVSSFDNVPLTDVR
jgi:hypothetical protein